MFHICSVCGLIKSSGRIQLEKLIVPMNEKNRVVLDKAVQSRLGKNWETPTETELWTGRSIMMEDQQQGGELQPADVLQPLHVSLLQTVSSFWPTHFVMEISARPRPGLVPCRCLNVTRRFCLEIWGQNGSVQISKVKFLVCRTTGADAAASERDPSSNYEHYYYEH